MVDLTANATNVPDDAVRNRRRRSANGMGAGNSREFPVPKTGPLALPKYLCAEGDSNPVGMARK